MDTTATHIIQAMEWCGLISGDLQSADVVLQLWPGVLGDETTTRPSEDEVVAFVMGWLIPFLRRGYDWEVLPWWGQTPQGILDWSVHFYWNESLGEWPYGR
jgi:hypothetical protein